MNDVASQWYEDTNNVNEMLDWNPALSVQERVMERAIVMFPL